jgi:RNA polymerase sigma factor (sigma-70 family)
VVPRDGIDELYREQYPRLKRIAFVLCGSNELAEDLVQDVFARSQDRLAAVDHPGSYLRASVVNACRSHHRHQVVVRRQPDGPEELVLPSQLVELHDALLALPHRQRAAVVLRYLCDLPDAEIASCLACREATVRSLIHRGLRHLREVIA